MLKAKLENGTVEIANDDDEISDGFYLFYTDKDGNSGEIILDILKDTGKASVIICKIGSDGPDACISLN